MKLEPFDFSPALRAWVDAGLVKRDHLAVLARIGPTTVHRLYHGESQPDVQTLRAWFSAAGLPTAFRQLCANAITDGSDVVVVVLADTCDEDGDGEVTELDARLIDAKKQAVAAERRLLVERALANGRRISPEIVAEDQRLAHLEIHFAHAHARALRELATQHPRPAA